MMRIKKYFSFLLSIAITLSFNLYPMQAIAENLSEVYKAYNLSIFSNTCDITSSEVLESNGKFYMNIEDIAKLARFELTTESDNSQNTFILRQGVRKICIQKETGDLLDYIRYVHVTGGNEHRINQIIIPYLLIESKYYYECIPLLTYLGAECKTSELGGLTVTMPAYTLWETIVPDMEKYWRDTNITNDSEVEKSVNIGVDIMNDMLGDISSIPSKLGAFKDALFAEDSAYMDGIYLKQALYEVFDVNVMSFDSVKNLIGESNKTANDNIEKLLTANDLAMDSLTSVYSLAKDCKYINPELLNDMDGLVLDGEWSLFLATMDAYATIDKRLKYDVNTKNCFINVLNNDSMEYINSLNYDKNEFEKFKTEISNENANSFLSVFFCELKFADIGFSPSWKYEALELSDVLNSEEKIMDATLTEKYSEAAQEFVVEFGAEEALAKLVGGVPASFGMLSTSLMTNVVLKDSFDASKSSIYSYCLSDMQYDILEPLTFVSLDALVDDECSDAEKMEIMKDMIALYYRITIAFCQNNAKAIEEYGFGKTKREQAVAYYNQVAEYLAVYLYMITNCTVSEIPDYDDIDDSVLTEEWMEQFSVNNIDNIVDSAYLKIEELKKEWGHYGEIWFQDLDFDGVNELIVSMGVYSEGYYFNGNEYIKITQQNVSENCASMDNLRLYYNTDTKTYGYNKEWGITLWHEVFDVSYKNGNFALNTIVAGMWSDGSSGSYNRWMNSDRKEITQQEYYSIYNKYVDSLIEYSYTVVRINTFEDSYAYANMNQNEKKERLKQSCKSFKIGEKKGNFKLLEKDFFSDLIINEELWRPFGAASEKKMWFQDLDLDGDNEFIVGGYQGGTNHLLHGFDAYEYTSDGNIVKYDWLRSTGEEVLTLCFDNSTNTWKYIKEFNDFYSVYGCAISLEEYGKGKIVSRFEPNEGAAEISDDFKLGWYDGEGNEITESQYAEIYNSFLKNLIKYSYITDVINLSDYAKMTQDERYERLKKSYDAFAIGKEVGEFEEYSIQNESNWKNAYLEYLESNANYKQKSGQFALINLNNDEIPDIFCRYEVSGLAGGGQSIWAYVAGEVKSVSLIKVIGVNGTEYQWNGEKVNNPYTEWDNVTHYSYEEIKSQIENS